MKLFIVLAMATLLLAGDAGSSISVRRTRKAKTIQPQPQIAPDGWIQLTFVNDTGNSVPAQYNGNTFSIPPGLHKYQFVFNPNTIMVFGAFDDGEPHYGYGSIHPDQMTGNNQVVVYHGGSTEQHIQFDNYFNAPFQISP